MMALGNRELIPVCHETLYTDLVCAVKVPTSLPHHTGTQIVLVKHADNILHGMAAAFWHVYGAAPPHPSEAELRRYVEVLGVLHSHVEAKNYRDLYSNVSPL